jgi:hypothetical protein
MPDTLFGQMIFDVRERIGCAGIFGDRVIIGAEMARNRIEGNVFEDRAKAALAGIALRLGVLRTPRQDGTRN